MLMALCLLGGACFDSGSPQSEGGQTHWLDECTRDADCGGLQCICQTCTVACVTGEECQEGISADAVCVAATALINASACGGGVVSGALCAPRESVDAGLVMGGALGRTASDLGPSMQPLVRSEDCATVWGPVELVVQPAGAFALSGSGLYFARGSSVWHTALDGSGATSVVGIDGEPRGFWMDGDAMYFATGHGNPGPEFDESTEPTDLFRWEGDEVTLVSELEHFIIELYADASHVYLSGMRQDTAPQYVNVVRIGRQDGVVEELHRWEDYFFDHDGGMLAVGDTALYFAVDPNGLSLGDGSLQRIDKANPLGADTFVPDVSSPHDPQWANGFVYWATTASENAGGVLQDNASIMRAPASGGPPEPVLEGLAWVDGFKVDGDLIYALVQDPEGGGRVVRAPLDRSQAPTVLAERNTLASGLQLTDSHVYWNQGCDAASGTVLRMAR